MACTQDGAVSTQDDQKVKFTGGYPFTDLVHHPVCWIQP